MGNHRPDAERVPERTVRREESLGIERKPYRDVVVGPDDLPRESDERDEPAQG